MPGGGSHAAAARLAALDEIARGAATLAAAHQAVTEALASADRLAPARVYTALRGFVWKALNGRRRDDALRDWHDLIGHARLRMAAEAPGLAERLLVLEELLEESVSAAAQAPAQEVAQRRHVREMLGRLAEAANWRLPRQDLRKSLGLEEANMTRIGNLAETAGLVERLDRGGLVEFALTALGRQHAPGPRAAPAQPDLPMRMPVAGSASHVEHFVPLVAVSRQQPSKPTTQRIVQGKKAPRRLKSAATVNAHAAAP